MISPLSVHIATATPDQDGGSSCLSFEAVVALLSLAFAAGVLFGWAIWS